MTWFWPGHSTFFSSAHASATKFARRRSAGAAAGSRRGARLAAARSWRISAISSSSLPVRRVPPAPAAVLPELDPVGRIPLRLVGLVVAPLALGAGERDRNSDSGLGHVSPGNSVLRGRLTHRPGPQKCSGTFDTLFDAEAA